MPLIIDGYNVLHCAGILGRGLGPDSLRRARGALLNFLAESLESAEVVTTTVVFDARDAPPGLPRKLTHRGITVCFAPPQSDADTLIEELIRRHSAPRRLTVVSSDHRLQRAANRRRAKAIDADIWYAEVVRLRQERLASDANISPRPPVPLLEEDVNYWLRQFGGESALNAFVEQELSRLSSETPHSTENPSESEAVPFDDIFPPGYGEDLLEKEPDDPRKPGV